MTSPPTEPTPLALHLIDLVPIESLDQLDTIGRAQLEKASKLYGGTELTAEQILTIGADEEMEEEGRIHPDFLERGRVIDAWGEHLYDVLLYMVDSGTVFARGTTEVVAEVIQMGVNSDNKELEKALDKALANRPERLPRKGSTPGALGAYEAAMKGALASKDKPGA